jgi:hypothetical protein
MTELRVGQEDRIVRLNTVREKERKARLSSGIGAFRGGGAGVKRAKPDIVEEKGLKGDKGDAEFLPEDKEEEERDGDGVYLSKEVRDLMSK